LAIGEAGAKNAALLAAAILATHDDALQSRLEAWREARTQAVEESPRDD
jgi:5-(carboxyamino)imidazole ribonucleotide mutase